MGKKKKESRKIRMLKSQASKRLRRGKTLTEEMKRVIGAGERKSKKK